MFFRKPQPPAPAGAKVTWDVKFPKGRKPFTDEAAAYTFAAEQRALPDGWAEVSRVVSTVVSPK